MRAFLLAMNIAIVWGFAWLVSPVWLPFYGLAQAIESMPMED